MTLPCICGVQCYTNRTTEKGTCYMYGDKMSHRQQVAIERKVPCRPYADGTLSNKQAWLYIRRSQ